MASRLIVNADDYGRTPGVAAGIRDAHRQGIVTSTTAMMNMPGAEEALSEAQRDCPHLGLGVHLVLTAGSPVLPTVQVRSLTGGSTAFPSVTELVRVLPILNFDELVAEWHAQVERFVAVTGRAPDHLDSHHNVSYLAPLLLRAMLELAREYGCAIRLPVGEEAERVDSDLPAGIIQPLARWSAPLLDEFRPRYPNYLDTSFYGPSATLGRLLELLAQLPPGTTELMSHPGYADAELLRGSSYNRQRESELAALTSAAVLAQVREQGIELISFAQL